MVEYLPYYNNQAFDYNNISNVPYNEQYIIQDNNLNHKIYQELMKSPVLYNEDQKYNNQIFNYYEGIPYQFTNDYSQLNNNMPYPLIFPLKKNENNSNINYFNIKNQYNPIILKLSKKMKNSQNSSISISQNSIKDSSKIIGDLNDFSQDFWKNFYDIDDPFFKFEDEGYTPIKTTKKITNIDNPDMDGIYTGDINSEGEMHGFGKLVSPNVTRIGTWRHNKFTGWGKEEWANGEIYEGKFVNGKLNGKGIYKDEYNFYIGDFKNSVKHGKGELFNNESHYVGTFKNDKRDGKGRIEIYGQGVYEGDIDDEKIDGYGVFKYNNGDYYEGEMKNGEMDGFGKLKYANGSSDEGYFKKGIFKGKKKPTFYN